MLMLLSLGAARAAECPTIQMGEEGRRKAESLAAKTREVLENSGAQVALLGRAGSDAPQKRFVKKINFWNYTHGGLVYRGHPDGEWTAVHLLNTCGEKSEVFSQSLTEFYLDNPFEYRTVAAIPSPRLQAALEELIIRRGLAERYHGDVYSSISYPFSLARAKFQRVCFGHAFGGAGVFGKPRRRQPPCGEGIFFGIAASRRLCSGNSSRRGG